ncbi:MAG: hypothetical protein KatS3mg065_0939 [Chloroflexota bacterium]|nr:MAG: hypothetical protein KatS3mg065_0939 [Chloroflexota bacterium]
MGVPEVIDMRLLVAEDDRRLAGLLRRGLEGEGYAVDVVGTAEETRWLAADIPYDTIVLDVMLPMGTASTSAGTSEPGDAGRRFSS